MNRLQRQDQAKIIRCLVDGVSLNAAVRITGFNKRTIMRLLVDLGQACSVYQDRVFRNLTCRRIQCDEIWSFVYAKDKNLPKRLRKKKGYGSVWTWIALDADTKLVPCWYVGERDYRAASRFIHDLKSRIKNRVQLTTDGHTPYLDAVEDAYGSEIDYAMLVKLYGQETDPENVRYSPSRCMGSRKSPIKGTPDLGFVSTSHVERVNLTMRMSNRRFTRLTNAFSKKIENHKAHIAVHFMYYNFARIHQTLRMTPAMAAGVADRVWDAEEMVDLLNLPD